MPDAYSRKEAIRKYVHRYLSSDLKITGLDLTVRDSLSELVRIHMREIASRQLETTLGWTKVIDQAIDATWADVLEIASSNENPRVQAIKSHLPHVRKDLKRTAKEIASLQNARVVAHTTDNFRFRTNVESTFKIDTLGSPKHIRGFFVSLPNKVRVVEIENLRGLDATVRGDWFPFEIQTGELTVVLDDDGSLYTSTENFPEHLVERSYENIKEIAEALYVILE